MAHPSSEEYHSLHEIHPPSDCLNRVHHITLWTIFGALFLTRPIAYYGAALTLFYPDWWIDGRQQASPVYVSVAVLFGCILLALACYSALLVRHKKSVELFLLLMIVHLWTIGGSAALLTRPMFDNMRPLVLFMLVASALNALILLLAKPKKK